MNVLSAGTSRQGTKQSLDIGKLDCRKVFGDRLRKKKSSENIRIIFQNINGYGTTIETKKEELIKDFIKQYKIDIYGMSEVNINWKLVKRSKNLHAQAKQWFENSNVSYAHNTITSTKTKHQPGGVALIHSGDTSLFVRETSFDKRYMGRWCSSLMQGKQQHKVRIVSVYTPSYSTTRGAKTVYNQQQAALLKSKITRKVLEIYWADFWVQIDEWLNNGEQLLIGGDWNHEVTDIDFQQEFRKRNLIPIITETHKQETPPPTYNRGSNPIDEVFATPGLEIVKCGYMQHGIIGSDHCPIWVEVSKRSMLGTRTPPLQKFQARKLKLNNPAIVDKYNTRLQEEFEKRNIYQRTWVLYNEFQNPLTLHQQELYDKLDHDRETAMKIAEKTCRKLHAGGVQWSPDIQCIRDKIYYLKLCLKQVRNVRVGTRLLIRMSRRSGLYLENVPETEIQLLMDQLFKEWKALKKQHQKKRRDFLEYIADLHAKNGEGPKASIVRNLIRLEQQRQMFRRLKIISGKLGENLSTTAVKVTYADGSTKEISAKKKMEEVIMAENLSKYHQSENTCPFLKEPLKSQFGEFGEGHAMEQVRQGTYLNNHPDPYVRDFISVCSPKGDMHHMKRTPSDYKKSWQKMREKTSSYDLHFGHFKAACKHDRNILVHYVLAEIPFRTGFSPERWQHATNVMILKKAGNYNLEKLRTLCLFQADFNHNNKFLGRTAMAHAVQKNYLAKEQYSVPGKKCISQALNKRLLFDISRYQKGCLAMGACDLKACHDRIVHAPATLAIQSVAIPKEPVLSMFSTIQDIQFHTRTAYGVSKGTFGGEDKNYSSKPQGAGQGNGAASQTWVIVSSKMFEILQKKGLSNQMRTPISQSMIDLLGFAFVDDADLFVISEENDPEATKDRMQELLIAWEKSAKVTGGALAPDKCWWYMIEYEEYKNTWRYKDQEDLETLCILDENNVSKPITHCQSQEAQEMLGVHLAPDGNHKAQLKEFEAKIENYAEKVLTTNLHRYDVWIGLQSIVMKSFEYALPVTTLTKTECDKLMWKLISAFLPKAGINRYVKQDILFAPISCQGFGLKNPYLVQGIEHVNDIIEHRWKQTVTGHFITSTLEFIRLELGLNIDILLENYKNYSYLLCTHSWIRSTWAFMSDHEITLKDNTSKVPMFRERDKPLMEIILQASGITHKQHMTINRCRMYLQIFSVADMVTGDGQDITEDAWEGIPQTEQRALKLRWPRSQTPTKSDWEVWKIVLGSVICRDNTRRLITSLGRWRTSPKDWKWFLTSNNNLIQKTAEDQYQIHVSMENHTRRKRYQIEGVRIKLLPTEVLEPTTIRVKDGCLITEGSQEISPYGDIEDDKAGSYCQWLYFSQQSEGKIEYLVTEIKNHTAIAVTDGSCFQSENVGSAAWIITTPSLQHNIQGTTMTPGERDDYNSFRSELSGIIAILAKLHDLCKQYNVTTGSITLACDNIATITALQDWTLMRVCPNQKNSDLISTCLKLRDTIPLSIIPIHVKGHQDERNPRNKLSLYEKLNVLMDKKAKSLAHLILAHPQVQKPLCDHPAAFPTCKWRDKTICHTIKNNLYDCITTDRAKRYWIEKGRASEDMIETINFKALDRCMNALPFGMKRFVSKWTTNINPNGKNIHRWNMRFKGNCPFCNHNKEDNLHILTCPHEKACKVWKQAIKKIIKKLKRLDTCRFVLNAIKKELNAGRMNSTLPSLQRYPKELERAIRDQRKLGWKSFLEGLLSHHWTLYMQEYYDAQKSNYSPTLWTARLIKYNLESLFFIWEKRNEQLHHTDKIRQLEGIPILKKAIQKEWDTGIGLLPASEFSKYFSGKIQTLFKQSDETLKSWLQVIRQARILMDPFHLIKDEFTTSKVLQEWIGISYAIEDEEGIPILEDAIKAELDKGPMNLPDKYKEQFNTTFNKIKQETLQWKQEWYCTIWKARECYDCANLPDNEFSYEGLLKDWVGLI